MVQNLQQFPGELVFLMQTGHVFTVRDAPKGIDRLTGLPDRQSFGESVLQQVLEADQTSVICLFDIDHFRFLNMIAGTVAGDTALQSVAAVLMAGLKAGDVIGRTGDDEFAIIFSGADIAEAQSRAEKLLAAISASRLTQSGDVYRLTACAGLVLMRPADEPYSWLMSAMATCAEAKDLGRGSVVVKQACDGLSTLQETEARIVTGLQSAIADNRLQLYAQEIINFDVDTKERQFELLVDMVDRRGRRFPAASVIPVAERHGFIRDLDRWVMKSVLVDSAAILNENPNLRLSLNLSGQSLADPGLWPFIAGLFERSGVAAGQIQFEITETSAISDMSVARAFVEAARGHGCKVALDDFGSGLSSFVYLRTFTVDCIKIDGAFVGNVTQPDSVDRAIVSAIVSVAHSLRLTVVAEHVDNTDVLATLVELGVDMIQGFLISQPKPFKEMFEKDAV